MFASPVKGNLINNARCTREVLGDSQNMQNVSNSGEKPRSPVVSLVQKNDDVFYAVSGM